MKTAHADCAHASTKLERERCRRARAKVAQAVDEVVEIARSRARHPSAGNGYPWVTQNDAVSVDAALPTPVHQDTPAEGSVPVRKPANRSVETITVNPGVWKAALALAGGKASRITVISPTRVEVI